MKHTDQRQDEPLTKVCTKCGEECWIVLFRVLNTGKRASWCEDCERSYDRERHTSSTMPRYDFVPIDVEAFEVVG